MASVHRPVRLLRTSLRVLFTLTALALSLPGCTVSQGDRCNPLQATNECTNGDTCVVPTNCVVAACCPATVTAQSPAACHVCPIVSDGGSTDVSVPTDIPTTDANTTDAPTGG